MKGTLLFAGGVLLVLTVLVFAGPAPVYSQGPTGTPTTVFGATSPVMTPAATGTSPVMTPAATGTSPAMTPAATGTSPVIPPAATPAATGTSAAPTGTSPAATPAGAPPPVAAGTNTDDPAKAIPFGSAIQSIPAGTAQWYSFTYNNGGTTLPRPQVTIRMINGVPSGLTYEIYAPESFIGNWYDKDPIGRGSQEIIQNCGSDASGRCVTNDLVWIGGFGANGTYYVRVINQTNGALAPQLVIGGTGVEQCYSGVGYATPQPQFGQPGTAFVTIDCANTAPTPVPQANPNP